MPHAKANGIEIYYELSGPVDAPVVMLSNSLGTRLEMWDPQMPALTERYRVLRYDSRGHGRSGAPPGPYSIAMLGGGCAGAARCAGDRERAFLRALEGRHGRPVACEPSWRSPGEPHLVRDRRAPGTGRALEPADRAERSRGHGGPGRRRHRALVHGRLSRHAQARDRAGARHDPRDLAAGLRRLLRRDPRHGPERGDPRDPHANPDRRRRRRPGHTSRSHARPARAHPGLPLRRDFCRPHIFSTSSRPGASTGR